MSEAVFEIYNPDSSLKLSLNNRTYKVLQYIPTNGNNGSATVSGISGTLVGIGMGDVRTKDIPQVSVTGNTVSWEFKSDLLPNDDQSVVALVMF